MIKGGETILKHIRCAKSYLQSFRLSDDSKESKYRQDISKNSNTTGRSEGESRLHVDGGRSDAALLF